MKFTFPPGSKPLDGYTIKRGIDRGGFGEVYYALSDAGKEVALKLLQDNLDVELRGVRQCLNLAHPNLVTIFDIRQDSDGDHWIIMEYLPGRTLEQVLDANPHGVSADVAEQWVSGIASGLAFLHECGIVHRDLKPANIFERDGVTKIGDVGLSKFITHSRRGAQTESVGTLYYMAPEVAKGNYGKEVDVYALGIIAFELLTGQVPFDGESKAEILMKHLTEQPDLTLLPADVRSVIAQTLEKDPHARPTDVTQFAADLRTALRGFEVPQTIPNESFNHAKPAEKTRERELSPYAVTAPGNADGPVDVFESPKPPKPTKTPRAEKSQDDGSPTYRLQTGSEDIKQPSASRRDRDQATSEHWHANTEDSQDNKGRAWKFFAIGLLLFVLISPRAVHDLSWASISLLAIGAFCFACWVGTAKLISLLKGQSNRTPAPHTPRKQPGHPSKKKKHELLAETDFYASEYSEAEARQSRMKRQAILSLSPDDPRPIPTKRRLSEMSGSLFMAAPFTAAITAAVVILTSFLPDNGQIGLFALTTLLASWAILFSMKLCEGLGDSSVRRIVLLVAGLAVGCGAYALDQTFMVDHVFASGHEPHGAMKFIGQHRLAEEGSRFQPTMAAYIVFFVGLFALRRWWWHTDLLRKARFQLGSAIFTLALGYILTAVFLFPHDWGMMWALAISCVVQLSAAWMPVETYSRQVLS